MLSFPPEPAAPRVGPAGPRSDAGTSAGASSGSVKEFSSDVSSPLISFPDLNEGTEATRSSHYAMPIGAWKPRN